MNGGLESARYSPYGFDNNNRGGNVNAGTGSTALYHHHGSRYGLGSLNGRPNGVDGKMNGLHGPKHKRGDIDRECMSNRLCNSLASIDDLGSQ